VQWFPLFTLPHPLLDIAKSPLAVTLETLSALVPLLVKVTVLGAVVVPTTWPPKLMLVGLTLTPGAVPVPLSDKTCVPALSVITM
jgi:hypothetical protein